MTAALIEEEEKEKQASLKMQVQKSRKKQPKSSKRKGNPPTAAQPSPAETQPPMGSLHTAHQTHLAGPAWQKNAPCLADSQGVAHTHQSSAGAAAGFTTASGPAAEMLQQPGSKAATAPQVHNMAGEPKPQAHRRDDRASASVRGAHAEPQK